MYYKDSPYGQASYPQQASAYGPGGPAAHSGAYYGGTQHHAQNIRAPLSHGYDGGDMMYGNIMNTVKDYFSNPWVIVIGAIIIVIIIAWLMSGEKENYRYY